MRTFHATHVRILQARVPFALQTCVSHSTHSYSPVRSFLLLRAVFPLTAAGLGGDRLTAQLALALAYPERLGSHEQLGVVLIRTCHFLAEEAVRPAPVLSLAYRGPSARQRAVKNARRTCPLQNGQVIRGKRDLARLRRGSALSLCGQFLDGDLQCLLTRVAKSAP